MPWQMAEGVSTAKCSVKVSGDSAKSALSPRIEGCVNVPVSTRFLEVDKCQYRTKTGCLARREVKGTYLIRGTAEAAGRTLTSTPRIRALVIATASERKLSQLRASVMVTSELTGLVAGTIVNESENGVLGCLAHIDTSLAHHLLERFHHGVLHTDVGGLRSSNEF